MSPYKLNGESFLQQQADFLLDSAHRPALKVLPKVRNNVFLLVRGTVTRVEPKNRRGRKCTLAATSQELRSL